MTILLSYDLDLQRVQIGAYGLGVGTTALVEWSLDGIRWSTVRGGAAVAVSGGDILVPLSHYEFSDRVVNYYRVTGTNTFTGTITPQLSGVWLRSIGRPFLSRQVQVVQPAAFTVTRTARNGLFDVVGRTFPVAVTDVRRGRAWTLEVRTEDEEEANDLDLLLAGGDVLLIHVPVSPIQSCVPGGYVVAGDASVTWHPLRPLRRKWTIPVVEVAAPGPDVVGSTGSWQTVLDQLGDWQAVLDGYASWAELLTVIADGSEVIVP